MPRRTPFRRVLRRVPRRVPGVYRFRDDVTYITRDSRNCRNHLFPKRLFPRPDGVSYGRASIRARKTPVIAGSRSPVFRHPVYRAAHRCISLVYRFGADVTALAKPLKPAEAGASRPPNGAISLITRASFSRYARERLSVRRSPSLFLPLSLFPFASLSSRRATRYAA